MPGEEALEPALAAAAASESPMACAAVRRALPLARPHTPGCCRTMPFSLPGRGGREMRRHLFVSTGAAATDAGAHRLDYQRCALRTTP